MPSGPIFARAAKPTGPPVDEPGIEMFDYWRHYFAAEAMRALIMERFSNIHAGRRDIENITQQAFEIADSMMDKSDITLTSGSE